MKKTAISILCVLLFAEYGQARRLEVIKSGHEKIPVDLSGIHKDSGVSSGLFIKTLQADLKRSGWFTISRAGAGAVQLAGRSSESGAYFTFNARVVNRATGNDYFERVYNDKAANVREMAHSFADDIVEAVKKTRGIASTKIVMIGSRSGGKDLYSCDYDGMNIVKLTTENAVCLAPSWGPEGKTIVYTSFCGGFPDVYRIDLSSMIRRKIASYPGLNAGADVSPDGRCMVLTLSKDGNPDLYIKYLGNKRLERVTRTRHAAEASPSWSPDGKRIVYVSNKTKRPHLYITSRNGTGEKRITYTGTENVSPDWGPDGRIAHSSRRDGHYHVCITDPSTGETVQLTSDSADYEDPSWAPDGRHIVCSRSVGFHSTLYILDTFGDPPLRLINLDGDWYSPAWSPR